MLCPALVGRDAELARVVGHITGEAGGVVAIVGSAGIGKSRLLDEAIPAADVMALRGRAVPSDRPVPFRPLTEACLSGFRGRPMPDAALLHGFEGQLGRLVPVWRTTEPGDDSPLLLGEAVARLLSVAGDGRPSVLVLEDLHWADEETIAVVEYLADALPSTGGHCVVTVRADDDVSRELVDRLERRHGATLIRLRALGERDVSTMTAACLDVPTAPAGLVDFVQRHTDGTPLLVEELLAGVIAARALTDVGGRWEVTGMLTVDVPASLRDSVSRRLALLDSTHRRVVGAAAMLGRSFAWELLPGIAEVDGRTVVEALRAAVAAQLVEASGDEFAFRHALSREAVIADLLPPERRELAARALPAIELAHPGLPGPTCELAADLAQAAGDSIAASRLLTESARRALASSAFVTAEGTARRARELAGDDEAARLDADEVLVQVLAAAGKPLEALAIGRPLAESMDAADVAGPRRVQLLLGLVRAGITGGDLDAAQRAADAAASIAEADGDATPLLLAQIAAAGGEVALERDELSRAEALTTSAIATAEQHGDTELLCDALIVLGRIQRVASHDDARASFQRASDIAERSGSSRWHLLARRELAVLDFARTGQTLLRETRDLAARYGAHITVAVMDLTLADLALSNYDREGSLSAASACVDASTRYGLATEPLAHLWLAGAHALGSDEKAMRAEIDKALERDPDDPRILADLYGRVLLYRAFVEDQLDTLPPLLDTMMEHVRRAPATRSVYPGRLFWAIHHAIDDEDGGAAAKAEYDEATRELGMPMFAVYGQLIEAVVVGRRGDADLATEIVNDAVQQVRPIAIGQGTLRSAQMVMAPAAMRDGWGDPATWLRDVETFFAERNYPRIVRRARALLAQTGAPLTRRGRGDSEVPSGLRQLGVTSREVDVLKLVVEGRSNREIADALYLSPKTVERHLSSLFVRTGVTNRKDLAAVGVAHLA